VAVKRAVLLALLASVACLALVACGGDDEPETTDTTPVETESVRAYFLRDGQVWPVRRDGGTGDGVRFALAALLEGPTEEEANELEATTAIPDGTTLDDVSVADGVATISLSSELPQEALAQVVYTATQFREVEAVDVQGQTRGRHNFEEQTPSVLVESPLAFDTVSPPIEVSGTANTFEATFNYEVVDADDFIIDEDFVTATSGSGTRGTFEFTSEFALEAPGDGALVVFELSAEDGSRIREVRIPLLLEG
jgi:germination protein M